MRGLSFCEAGRFAQRRPVVVRISNTTRGLQGASARLRAFIRRQGLPFPAGAAGGRRPPAKCETHLMNSRLELSARRHQFGAVRHSPCVLDRMIFMATRIPPVPKTPPATKPARDDGDSVV